MGAVNFYLKKPEVKTGKSLIYLQYKYQGQKLVYSFGETIDPGKSLKVDGFQNWSTGKQRVRSNRITTKDGQHSLNNLLDTLSDVLLDAYRKELPNGFPPPQVLKKYLDEFLQKNINTERPDIWNLVERFISGEIKDEETKKRKTPGTLKNYKTVKGHLLEFEKHTKQKINFNSFTWEFLDKYIDYLRDNAKLSQNTIAKNIQTIKVFLRRAAKEKLTTNQIFTEKGFSATWEESESVALSRREIDKLFKHDFSGNKRYDNVRDLFVFGCNVGLRFGDFSNVQPHNIIEVDGEKHIKIIQKKTGDMVQIPCHDDVLKIFEKYKHNLNNLPRKVTDVEFNRVIKKVCEEAGLTEKGRLTKDPEKQLFECVSSHTCRRSMCTNLFNEGVPPIIIMKISGHKTETSFLKYIKVSQQNAAAKLSAHYKKMKESKMVAV